MKASDSLCLAFPWNASHYRLAFGLLILICNIEFFVISLFHSCNIILLIFPILNDRHPKLFFINVLSLGAMAYG
jgi:hypothetical protein